MCQHSSMFYNLVPVQGFSYNNPIGTRRRRINTPVLRIFQTVFPYGRYGCPIGNIMVVIYASACYTHAMNGVNGRFCQKGAAYDH